MSDRNKLCRNKILKELYLKNNLTCADLSFKINKSLPITAALIDVLIKDKSIKVSGYSASTGGRKPLAYSIQQDSMYLLAVAMDQYITSIALMDMQQNLVAPIIKIQLPLANNPAALEQLTKLLLSTLQSSQVPFHKIQGIGIGMPGFVDIKKGSNYSYMVLLNTASLAHYLSDKTNLPVYLDNDSSLIALAEKYFGNAHQEQNTMVINIGWGVGLGMIMGAELYRGQEGFAGELSHIPLFSNGQLCWCGKNGCLETEASLTRLLQMAKEGIASGRATRLRQLNFTDVESSFAGLIDAVKEGDQFATELFSKVGYNLGKGIAIIIHLLNPQKIILSGIGALAGPVWLAPIQQSIQENCIPRLYKNTVIEISSLASDAAILGAGTLIMEHFTHLPAVKTKQIKNTISSNKKNQQA